MKMRREDRVSAAVSIVIALGLAAGSLYLARIAERAPESAGSRGGTDQPDSFAESVRVNRTRADGSPAFLLTAQRIEYFRGDDSTLLHQPVLTSLDTTQAEVRLRASTGRSLKGSSEILLIGDVFLERASDQQTPKMTIATEWAQVLTDAEIARTDRPIEVRRGTDVLTGVGMEFNNAARTLRVDHQVRATFFPAPRKP